jgi:hypothetical protein
MVTYHLSEPAAMSVPIRGRFLAHNHHHRVARAFIAADLVSGTTRLVEPTLSQASALCGVNRTYVFWAVKRMPQRAEIEADLVPLVPAVTPRNGNGHLWASAAEIGDAELTRIAHIVGADRMLAAAAAPDVR